MPVLIASRNEEFRQMIREMLDKNGIFHVWEAKNEEDSLSLLKNANENAFTIIQSDLLSLELTNKIMKNNYFIVLSQPESEDAVTLAARLGVKHFMSFPFSARNLMEKINSLT